MTLKSMIRWTRPAHPIEVVANLGFPPHLPGFTFGTHAEAANQPDWGDQRNAVVTRSQSDTSPESLANTFKGAILDETILEVQIHDLKEIFFCRILDNPFEDNLADEDANFSYPDPDYESGGHRFESCLVYHKIQGVINLRW